MAAASKQNRSAQLENGFDGNIEFQISFSKKKADGDDISHKSTSVHITVN